MKTFWRFAGLPLALALLFPAAAPAQNAVTVFVNGQAMSFDQPPVVQGGRVFVPMRAVFQQLGASVVYNNGQINATGGGRTISLTIGSTTAYVNGQQQILDVAPFTVGDRTLVPLRFIATALGANVNWDSANNSVTITHGGYNAPPMPRPPMPRPPMPRPPMPRPPPPTLAPPPPTVIFAGKSPTGTIFNNQPTIAFQLNRPTRMNLFRVTVDGNAVPMSSLNQVTNASYNFQYKKALGQGRHTVRVWGQSNGGVPFDIQWSFLTAAAR